MTDGEYHCLVKFGFSVFMWQLFAFNLAPPPHTSHSHTRINAPDGCNWCAGTVAANNCNYQKWLVSWKQSHVSFSVWVRGSDVCGTLGFSTLQLIFNTLKLIVLSHAELSARWCETKLPECFYYCKSCQKEGSAAPFDNDNAPHTQAHGHTRI